MATQTAPLVFPVDVELKFKFRVTTPEDYEYLTTKVKEEGIISDASEIFENLDLACIEVNGEKTT